MNIKDTNMNLVHTILYLDIKYIKAEKKKLCKTIEFII